MNRCDIGWWGGNCLQGYCRTYENSQLKRQGWYQNSVQNLTKDYKSTAYPYWEAKEEYVKADRKLEFESVGDQTLKRIEEDNLLTLKYLNQLKDGSLKSVKRQKIGD